MFLAIAKWCSKASAINASNLLSSESWAVYGEASRTSADEKWVVTIGGRFYEEKRSFNENIDYFYISSSLSSRATRNAATPTHSYLPDTYTAS